MKKAIKFITHWTIALIFVTAMILFHNMNYYGIGFIERSHLACGLDGIFLVLFSVGCAMTFGFHKWSK